MFEVASLFFSSSSLYLYNPNLFPLSCSCVTSDSSGMLILERPNTPVLPNTYEELVNPLGNVERYSQVGRFFGKLSFSLEMAS